MNTVFKILMISSMLLFVSCDPDDVTGPENIDYILGQPEIAGTGCQDTTIRISNDGKSVIMDTESLTVKAGSSYKSLARINCLAAVPIAVPSDYKVAVLPAKFSGKYLLQKNSTLKVSSESFLAGQTGQQTGVEINGKSRGQFLLSTSEFKDASISECGADTTLRLNLRIFLKSKNKQEASAGKITGLADGEKSIFKLKFIKC